VSGRALLFKNRPHGSVQNAGYMQVRQSIAARMTRDTGLEFPPENIFVAVGPSGVCSVILKSVLDPGAEVIVLRPCFFEHPLHITNHAGRVVLVEINAQLLPNDYQIAAAVTPRCSNLLRTAFGASLSIADYGAAWWLLARTERDRLPCGRR
jgi:aspartate aminotransferase